MADDPSDALQASATASPIKQRNRRQWRRLAFCLLFAVGAVWYLLIPRTDRRFVGRWQTQYGWNTIGTADLHEFRSDGTCELFGQVTLGSPLSSVGLWSWQVDEDVLVLYQRSMPDPSVPKFVDVIRSIADRWSRRRDQPTRFRILEVTKDQIVLMTIPVLPGYEPQKLILNRVQPSSAADRYFDRTTR
jgi:hypothetical protein